MKEIIHESHTADVQILVEADTLEELFTGALEGMNSILKASIPSTTNSSPNVYPIEITFPDLTNLLIDFLSEVLTIGYEKSMVFPSIKILELKTYYIKAILYGIPVESFDEDIKAVTYHLANVEKNSRGKWQTRIIFDI